MYNYNKKKPKKKRKIIINGWACMCVCERQVTFSLGLWIIVSFIISSIGNLIILNVLIWLDRCSFAFLFIHFFHILSHSPCLHHSLFIYIHILCLIFSSSLLLHLLLQFNFFFFILSLLIYSYCFFLPHWYIHIGHLSIHGLWDFLHILHFVHEGMGLIIGYLSLVFFRFFTLLP